MKTFITIFHNPETDDTFAGIIQDERCFCYSQIGQHSSVSMGYLEESDAATINIDSLAVWQEVKEIYNDYELTLLSKAEFINVINNEQIKFGL